MDDCPEPWQDVGMRFIGIIALVALLCGSVVADEIVPKQIIDQLTAPAMDGQYTVGMIIGLINEHGRQVVGYGKRTLGDPALPNGQTVYEIGSVTKTFTATLLADAVIRGEVKLDDPVQQYLPADVKSPVGPSGRPITLLQLSTHSSGLLGMPGDFPPGDWTNPKSEYSLQKLDNYISSTQLSHEPGERCAYSNVGVAL